MSIAVLVQVYDEVRRLAIAGSAVAPGDFRLKKLVPPLEKSGEKAPVFAKVAQAAAAVVDSNEKTAASALLELTTLVNAILYTQGETGIAGTFAPLETKDLGGQATQVGARVLKPLLEALNSTGSGRLELVRDAFERGTFKDLRLVKPALRAIDDPYPELGDFIAQKVLPLYGKAILPELRARLDLKGRGGHINRLQLMHQLDPQGSRDLVQAALNDGSKEMKVAAVECLGTTDEDLVYLLDQVKAKAKDVRAAAIRALAVSGAAKPEVVAALKKAISGADLELFIMRARECTLAEVQDHILEQAELLSKELLKLKDKKEQGAAIERLQQLVYCLDGRTDAGAEAFLLGCFENAAVFAAIKSEPSGADLNELLAHVLSRGTPRMQEKLVAANKSLSGGMLTPAIFAARRLLPPADFYTEFSPLLKATGKRGKKGAEAERGNALLSALIQEGRYFLYRHWMRVGRYMSNDEGDESSLKELDPRWLDAAIDAGSMELVSKLAKPGHAPSQAFLTQQLAGKKEPYEMHQVLETMIRIGHPEATDAVIESLKKHAKSTTYYYHGYWFGRLIAELPRSAFPKIEEALPSLPEKVVDQLMDSVMALKNKPL